MTTTDLPGDLLALLPRDLFALLPGHCAALLPLHGLAVLLGHLLAPLLGRPLAALLSGYLWYGPMLSEATSVMLNNCYDNVQSNQKSVNT